MPYILNEAAAGTYPRQAVPMALDFDNLLAALSGNGVVEGLAVSAGTGLTYSVAVGTAYVAGRFTPIAAVSNQAMTAASGSNPRIDVVVITSAGAVAVRTGTAAAAPVPPTYTAGDIVLAFIWVPTSATSLTATNIVDKRLIVDHSGIIYNVGAQTGVSTIVTNQNVFPGVTIPANFLKAGDHIRVRAWFSLTTLTTPGNLTFRVKLGTTVLATTGAVAMTASQTSRTVMLEIDLVVISTTSIEAQGAVNVNTSATAVARWGLGATAGSTNNSPITVTSNTAQVLTIDITSTVAAFTLTPRIMTAEMH